MKVFVTGGTGYIGRILVPMMAKAGYEVTVLDRMFLNYDDVVSEYTAMGVKVIRDDIRYFEPNLLNGFDSVVDLAALSNDPSGDLDPLKTWDINYLGRVRVARLSKKLGVKRYVMASSCSVYGFRDDIADETSVPNPLTTYAQANIGIERDNLPLGDDNFTTTALRFATAFGYSKRMRFDLAINAMALNTYNTGVIKLMRDGEQFRPFVHIVDISRSIMKTLDSDKEIVNREIFNIGSDSLNLKLKDLANLVGRTVDSSFKIEWYGDPDARSYRASFKKATERLGFAANVSIEAGVKEIVEELKNGELKDILETHTMEFYKKLIQAQDLIEKYTLVKANRVL